MNRLHATNIRRLTIIAVCGAAVSIALLFWARDVIREVIVNPVSYIFWLASILIRSTPQIFFWIALFIILLLVAWRSMMGKRKVYIQPPLITPEGPGSTGRVLYWNSKVNLIRTGRGGYYAVAFHIPMGRLLMDLIGHRFRLTSQQVEDLLRENTLEVPAVIRDYILSSLRPKEPDYRGFFHQLWQDLLEFIFTWLVGLGLRQPAPADPRIAVIIKYMEEELEVSHDNSSS